MLIELPFANSSVRIVAIESIQRISPLKENETMFEVWLIGASNSAFVNFHNWMALPLGVNDPQFDSTCEQAKIRCAVAHKEIVRYMELHPPSVHHFGAADKKVLEVVNVGYIQNAHAQHIIESRRAAGFGIDAMTEDSRRDTWITFYRYELVTSEASEKS